MPIYRKIKNQPIILASDHAGFKLKELIKKFLVKKRKKVLKKNQFGVLVCGSGVGMDISANKHKNVRAALCYNIKIAKLSRKHNNANVIAIGARLTKIDVALKCVDIFLNTAFEGGRHLRRIKKI